jgi:hypothetical protein
MTPGDHCSMTGNDVNADKRAATKRPGADLTRRAAVSSGNPRITVAFPLSRIDIREPSDALRDLAALVEELAEQSAALTNRLAPDRADEVDRLAAQAALLARRIGATR